MLVEFITKAYIYYDVSTYNKTLQIIYIKFHGYYDMKVVIIQNQLPH